MRTLSCVVVISLLFAPISAKAQQRREGEASAKPLRIAFDSAVRFSDTTIGAGVYRISVGDGKFTFAHDASMVAVATVSAERKSGSEYVYPPRVKVRQRNDVIEVIVLARTERYVASGVKVAQTRKSEKIEYGNKNELSLMNGSFDQSPNKPLLVSALNRNIHSVTHCGEVARRNRWQTDDPRFVRCVCPATEKWRFPKVKSKLRVHRILLPGKAGMTITVGTDGHVYDCRVWVGAKSPELPAETKENEPLVISVIPSSTKTSSPPK